jgi:predicted phosphodiesterase
MRLAVLNDIHGNLPALEAVLEDARTAQVDRIVVGGDVVPGPMPQHALKRLRGLEIPIDFIFGNGEVAILQHAAGKPLTRVPAPVAPLIRWSADQLDAAEREFLAAWPMTMRLHVPPLGDVLFCHATPRNENEVFTQLTDERRLMPIFDATDAALVVCGHTHMQFDRMVGRTRVVNAGSVGMPFGRAGADWLVVGPEVELRHTEYDLNAAAERIRRSGYPAAEEFAEKYVLQTPKAEDMLRLFTEHELKD